MPTDRDLDPPLYGTPVPGKDYWWRPGVYGLALDAHGRLAVVEVEGQLFLPGGGIEEGESDQLTLQREFAEETGLVVQVQDLVREANEYTWSRAEGYFVKQGRFYEASLTGDTVPQVEDDHLLVWMDRTEAAARLTHESQRDLVTRWGEHGT
jgi:8-oxo-dGTP diphosphatase